MLDEERPEWLTDDLLKRYYRHNDDYDEPDPQMKRVDEYMVQRMLRETEELMQRQESQEIEREYERTKNALHRAQDEALRLQGLERPRSQYITTLESRCAALESDLERSQAVRLDLYKDNQRMTLAIANLRREAPQGKSHRRAYRQARRRQSARPKVQHQPFSDDDIMKSLKSYER